MSNFRAEIDVSFNNEQDLVDLLNYIENMKSKAYKPKGTEKIQCHRSVRFHKCTHDDAVPQPCSGYEYVEFDKIKKVHIKKGGTA